MSTTFGLELVVQLRPVFQVYVKVDLQFKGNTRGECPCSLNHHAQARAQQSFRDLLVNPLGKAAQFTHIPKVTQFARIRDRIESFPTAQPGVRASRGEGQVAGLALKGSNVPTNTENLLYHQ